MTSKHAARSANGRYSNFGHRAEAAARDAKRIPVTRHVSRSVGCSTGTTRLDAASERCKGARP